MEIATTINANHGDCSIPKCLQSWRAIKSRYIYYVPRGYDECNETLFHLLSIERIVKSKHQSKPFSIISLGGMLIQTGQFVEPVHGGLRPCSVALGPMLIDARCFASIPVSRASWLEPWSLSEELAISVLGARVLRRSACYTAPVSQFNIERGMYCFDGWKSMWGKCAKAERDYR